MKMDLEGEVYHINDFIISLPFLTTYIMLQFVLSDNLGTQRDIIPKTLGHKLCKIEILGQMGHKIQFLDLFRKFLGHLNSLAKCG